MPLPLYKWTHIQIEYDENMHIYTTMVIAVRAHCNPLDIYIYIYIYIYIKSIWLAIGYYIAYQRK